MYEGSASGSDDSASSDVASANEMPMHEFLVAAADVRRRLAPSQGLPSPRLAICDIDAPSFGCQSTNLRQFPPNEDGKVMRIGGQRHWPHWQDVDEESGEFELEPRGGWHPLTGGRTQQRRKAFR